MHGTLSGIGANLTYTPDSGYVGIDTFTFKANDGTSDSNIATVTITVHGPNHPPVASDTSVTVASGNTTPMMFIASDADGDPLTYSVVSSPSHGTLSSGLGPNRTYTPNAGYLGNDVLTFKANDGTADSNVATVAISVVSAAQLPSEVSSLGYINGTSLTRHTTGTFNSAGATTLVVFVSTNSPWNGQPVSISGVTDNMGNSWSVLTGPTQWNGSQYGLLSGVYYVNVPITSSAHAVTVQLTNPAPLVMDVFALSGSDIVGPPVYSAITAPVSGGTSATVTTAPITVPANSLLLSWAKNETSGTATAIDGYKLDAGSTSYLWAESQTVLADGSYTGDFQYDSSIGWQTAVVGLKPAGSGPVAFNQSVTASDSTPFNLTLTAESLIGLPLTYSIVTGPVHGTLSGIGANLTYTPNSSYIGADTFKFKANDGISDSNVATVTISVVFGAPSPAEVSSQGYINSNSQTAHTTAPFNTVGATTLVMFVGSHSPWNGQSVSISSVGDNAGNSWNLLTGPTLWIGNSFPLLAAIYYVNIPSTSNAHTVTVRLTNPAPLVMDIFAVSGSDITGPPVYSAITDPGAGITSASVMTAPITVPAGTLLLSWTKNETSANATAIDGYNLDTGSTSYLWAESETAGTAGSYTGDFLYNASIGWQTAVVGLKPGSGPAAFNQTVTASYDTSLNITLKGVSPTGLPLSYSVVSGPTNGSLLGTPPNVIYTPNSSYTRNDTFTFKANDGTTDSNIATVSITVAAPQNAPHVSGISPNSGPVAGGAAVTITGTNFATGATVTFGSSTATNVVVVNSTTITATTLAGGAGAVTATVTNADGQNGSLTNGFTYVATPTVSRISPNNGPAAGGTAVTITGTNFAAGATVTFGSAAAANVVVVNSTTITATTPTGSIGAVTVTVTESGQTGSLPNGFTYNPLTAISFAQVASATPQAPLGTVSVSYPGAQTLGDLNIVVVGWNDTTATVQSVEDSAGNTYKLAIGPTSGTALRQSIYYAANITGGSNTVTVTFSQAAAYPDIRILEYKGVTTLDVVAGAIGNSKSANSGTATTTRANELIVGADMVATTTGRAGAGFTSRIITSPDSDIAEDKIVTTTGSNSASATLNTSGPWVMQMVTFK